MVCRSAIGGVGMCGRYQLSTEEENSEIRRLLEEVSERYAGTEEYQRMKTGEVFPSDIAPVLTREEGGIIPRLLRWGFPAWQGKGLIINARRESLGEKPTFRGLLASHRCAVPASGFYEWQQAGAVKKKDKYYLYEPGRVIYLAGLYTLVKDREGRAYPAYVIITTSADPVVGRIHDRMPVIFDRSAMERWLEPGAERGRLEQLLAEALPDLRVRQVS